jgi:hypothetical protein
MSDNNLFIEETTAEGFNVIWKNGSALEAIDFLIKSESKNRLELWTKAHANTVKGFAPLVFREKNKREVKVSKTFEMFYLG